MPRNYYYAVAGLPDIVIEGGRAAPSVSEFIAEMSDVLHPGDVQLLRVLQLPRDNDNLVALLEKNDAGFDEQGMFTKDELEAEIRVSESVPEYMKNFIEAHKEGRSLFQDISPRDQLSWLFYDEMNSHSNPFIREWFAFDCNLRNLLSALNCRARMNGGQGSPSGYALASSIIGRNDVSELILRSSAADFSLGQVFPRVERVVSLDRDDLVEFEKNIDLLRWDFCNEITVFAYFGIEAILAFCVKLGMVNRWQALSPDRGREMLNRLVSELESGFHLSEDFQ